MRRRKRGPDHGAGALERSAAEGGGRRMRAPGQSFGKPGRGYAGAPRRARPVDSGFLIVGAMPCPTDEWRRTLQHRCLHLLQRSMRSYGAPDIYQGTGVNQHPWSLGYWATQPGNNLESWRPEGQPWAEPARHTEAGVRPPATHTHD